MDVRYVGTLSRKLYGTINLNAPNFLYNGLKEAFDAARAGEESPLLDQMFKGINIAGAGFGPVGTVVNGVLQTGAMHLRNSAAATTGAAGALAGSIQSNLGKRKLPGGCQYPEHTQLQHVIQCGTARRFRPASTALCSDITGSRKISSRRIRSSTMRIC
jgi:hypothetical protein